MCINYGKVYLYVDMLRNTSKISDEYCNKWYTCKHPVMSAFRKE